MMLSVYDVASVMTADAEPLLTARQVSQLLGLSTPSVLRRWRAGELPGFRLSTNVLRFRRTEIDAWLEDHRGPCRYKPLPTLRALSGSPKEV